MSVPGPVQAACAAHVPRRRLPRTRTVQAQARAHAFLRQNGESARVRFAAVRGMPVAAPANEKPRHAAACPGSLA